MRIFTDFTALPPLLGCAVTIGNFDGVHRGHRVLIDAVDAAARREGLLRTVLTFEPHPMEVVAPGRAPVRVVPPEEKLALLEAAGVDVVLAQRFDPAFAALTPQAFIERVLVDGLHTQHLVIGYDFSFGRRRAGNADTLKAAGKTHGFSVETVSAQRTADTQPASSSRVRAAVAAGAMAEAAEVLGRPFALAGTVVRGHQRGRVLGFPTANVATTWSLHPKFGVYAGWLDWGAGPAPAVVNVGRNPTFGAEAPPTIEAHVLGRADLDLYDRPVRLWFATRLRDERRFESVEALRAQIARDAEQATLTLADQAAP